MNEIKKILQELESNVVVITESDVGIGSGELLSVDESSCKVQYFTFCSCYPSGVYSPSMYTEAKEIPYERIYEVIPLPKMSKEEIEKRREQSIVQDAPIFERYKTITNK